MAEPSIGKARRPTILVVGAATRDVDPTDARGWRLGGGVTYGAMAVARLGLPVRALVGVDEEAADAREVDVLRRAGADVHLVPLPRGPVFDNRRADGGRLQVALRDSAPLRVRSLPPEWRSADAVVLAPVAGELGPAWARAFGGGPLVALGWQGLLRRLVPGTPVEALPLRRLALVDRADLAQVSAEDVRAGGASLARLLRRPGQQLVVTSGPRPALHLVRRPDGRLTARFVPALPAGSARDATGAGDVFLATWTAVSVAAPDSPPWGALAIAAAGAAAKVDAATLAELADLRAICQRLLRPRDGRPTPP